MARKKELIVIITMIIVAAAILICLWPRTDKIIYTLDATQFNANGEQIGSAQFLVESLQKRTLLQDSQAELSIQPFDGLSWLKIVASGDEFPAYYQLGEIYYLFYSAWDQILDEAILCTLAFDAQMDRWMILNNARQTYYVASVSGAYTLEELTSYFSSIIPINW